MDYIVADRFLIPVEIRNILTEKPLYLPNTYMPTDNRESFLTKPMNRATWDYLTMHLFSAALTITIRFHLTEFDIWMRLLTKVENSVLWLRQSNQISNINMKNEAQKRKVDPSRLVFADKVPMDEHLARQRLADLFVDTFAFNAHTTAS